VTLTATPGSGSQFNGWAGDCTGTGGCTVTVAGAQSVTTDFEFSKTVASPFFSASPSPLNFATVQTSTSYSLNLQVTNTGPSNGGDLIISGATPDNAAYTAAPGQFPLTIPVGTTSQVKVTFSPTVNGTVNATLSFASNGSNSPTPVSVTGAGGLTTTAGGQLIITPSPLFFGNVNFGSSSVLPVTLSNPGNANTTVLGVTITGNGLSLWNSTTFPFVIPSGGSAIVGIQFAPPNTGAVTGVLTFSSDAISPTVSIVASGNGTTQTISVIVLPTSLNFGTVIVGSSEIQLVNIFNTGNTDLTVNPPSISGNGFLLDLSIFPLTIPVNGEQPIPVIFTPPSSGPFPGSISFNTNATGSQPVVSLSGGGGTTTTHTATLTWASSTSSVVGYYVYRSTTSGNLYSRFLVLLSGRTFTDTSVVSGKTYYWVVTAVDGAGNESGFSAQVSATIP
jgi:hypothetical protein